MLQDNFTEWVDETGGFSRRRLNRGFIDEIRRGLYGGVSDDEIAHALIDLLIEDLPEDEDHDGLMDNSETGAVIRCLRAVLRRLGVECDLPFHDKIGFRAAMRPNLAQVFAPIREALVLHEGNNSGGGLRGPRGELRNLIFAAPYKPVIVLRDVPSQTIEITENKEHCLLYDHPVKASGLTWGDLVDWWKHQDGNYAVPVQELYARLRKRLTMSLKNDPEQLLLNSYWQFCLGKGFEGLPALLPQVHLHHDPLTRRQREQQAEGQVLERQRMDFLLLAPGGGRYVLEVDGKKHYSCGGQARPDLYASMVREDRRIRLQGYEVYRFGGAEFVDQQAAETMLNEFFTELLEV